MMDEGRFATDDAQPVTAAVTSRPIIRHPSSIVA
jgi:hypothetical protein